MKKRLIIITAAVLTLLISATAMAATNPFDFFQSKGLDQDQVQAERAAGKTYGQIAADAGVLDEFKDEMLQYKFDIIDQRVEEGVLTQEQAEAFKAELKERIQDCDGTPDPDRERLGQSYGGGMRFGQGFGQGGRGRGMGFGRGGQGMGCGRNFNQ